MDSNSNLKNQQVPVKRKRKRAVIIITIIMSVLGFFCAVIVIVFLIKPTQITDIILGRNQGETSVDPTEEEPYKNTEIVTTATPIDELIVNTTPTAQEILTPTVAEGEKKERFVWEYDIVDNSEKTGYFLSMKLDTNSKKIYVAYLDDSVDKLVLAENTYPFNSNWTQKIVAKEGVPGFFASLDLLPSGFPVISYYNVTHKQVLFISFTEESFWEYDVIQIFTEVGDTTVKVDPEGFSHVLYLNTDTKELVYVNNRLGKWNQLKVGDTTSECVNFPLEIDADGHPATVYYDVNNGLIYSWLDRNEIWQKEVISNTGTFSHPSLVIDEDGNPHVTFHDSTNGDLYYAVKVSGSWNIELLDEEGQVGEFNSIAISSTNQVFISYYDRSQGNLKLAYFDGADWNISITDDNDFVGEYSSILVLDRNTVIIAYRDEGNDRVKIAVGQVIN